MPIDPFEMLHIGPLTLGFRASFINTLRETNITYDCINWRCETGTSVHLQIT